MSDPVGPAYRYREWARSLELPSDRIIATSLVNEFDSASSALAALRARVAELETNDYKHLDALLHQQANHILALGEELVTVDARLAEAERLLRELDRVRDDGRSGVENLHKRVTAFLAAGDTAKEGGA